MGSQRACVVLIMTGRGMTVSAARARRRMNPQKNIEAQRRFIEAINSGRLVMLKELIDPSLVDHDPATGQRHGAAGYIDFFSELLGAFPDLKIQVKHLVADEHSVAMAYKMTGTHRGSFLGVEPTGHTIISRGIQIGRYNGGRIVERWGVMDELGILEQLGVAPGRNRAMA